MGTFAAKREILSGGDQFLAAPGTAHASDLILNLILNLIEFFLVPDMLSH